MAQSKPRARSYGKSVTSVTTTATKRRYTKHLFSGAEYKCTTHFSDIKRFSLHFILGVCLYYSKCNMK